MEPPSTRLPRSDLIAVLLVLVLFSLVLGIGGAAAQSDGSAIAVGNATGSAGENVTVAVNATADGVASYETSLTYDSSAVRVVAIEGGDFPEPVSNVDSEVGRVNLTQVETAGPDDPTLARITFELTGDVGTETAIDVDSNATAVFDSDGDAIRIEHFSTGHVSIDDSEGAAGPASSPNGENGGLNVLLIGGGLLAVVLIATVGFLAGRKLSG